MGRGDTPIPPDLRREMEGSTYTVDADSEYLGFATQATQGSGLES